MNATLRSVLLTASLLTASFGAVTISACSEDKCKATVCANGSVCSEGSCICPSGYEGPRCETVNRERFIGTWQVSEDGSVSASAEYAAFIEPGDGITQVVIKIFNNFFTDNVKARVKGDTIYIDPQTFSNNYTVVGQGYIMDDKYYGRNGRITLRYSVTNPFGVVNDYGYVSPTTYPSQWTK